MFQVNNRKEGRTGWAPELLQKGEMGRHLNKGGSVIRKETHSDLPVQRKKKHSRLRKISHSLGEGEETGVSKEGKSVHGQERQ